MQCKRQIIGILCFEYKFFEIRELKLFELDVVYSWTTEAESIFFSVLQTHSVFEFVEYFVTTFFFLVVEQVVLFRRQKLSGLTDVTDNEG